MSGQPMAWCLPYQKPSTTAAVPAVPAVPVVTYTPGQLAWQASTTVKLQPVRVGVPTALPGHNNTSYVNVPIWYWVTNPAPTTTTGLSVNRTLHGVTVHLTASRTSITWHFGDGASATCGLGTPWSAAAYTDPVTHRPVPSPDCGHTYTRRSPSGHPYSITATTTWIFRWNAAGQSGTIPVPALTSAPVPITIKELEVLNSRPG